MEIRSYIVRVWAKEGKLLRGGVKQTSSSRFACEQGAKHFLATMLVEQDAQGIIFPSTKPPEI